MGYLRKQVPELQCLIDDLPLAKPQLSHLQNNSNNEADPEAFARFDVL